MFRVHARPPLPPLLREKGGDVLRVEFGGDV
jgi:hypothetical protein